MNYYWLGIALGASLGMAIGIGIVVVVIVATRTVVPPSAQPLIDFLAECAGKHTFGSPELDRCVDECLKRKRRTR